MIRTELEARLKNEMREFSDSLTFRETITPIDTITDTDTAIQDASDETGWMLPVSGKQAFWFKQRVKRHLLAMLRDGRSLKYQAKSYSLNQQYEQLADIIDKMDEEWEQSGYFVSDQPEKMFGTVIGTGIVHDRLGRERIVKPYFMG